jgi:hypothetical protein
MTAPPATTREEFRAFAEVLRKALLMVVRYLEKTYQIGGKATVCPRCGASLGYPDKRPPDT